MRSLPVAWLLFLTAVSLLPYPVKIQLGTTGFLHQVGHFGMFFVTALILCRRVSGFLPKLARCFGALVLAVILELLETSFFRYSFEWMDVWADAAGIFAGLLLMTLIGMSQRPSSALPGAKRDLGESS